MSLLNEWDEDEEHGPEEAPTCPIAICGGHGLPLGVLGNLAWYRCRYCGLDFHTKGDE